MSNCVELQNIDVQIFNLPEEIFRVIFSYLDADDLHLNLKSTCQKMKNYVTNYMECEQTLILLSQKNYQSTHMEAVQMIKFANKKLIIHTKATIPAIPNQRGHTSLVFAATIHKRIVIGVDYNYGILNFFSLEKGEWRHTPGERMCHYYDESMYSKVIWSQIGESNIILFHTIDGKDTKIFELLHFHKNEVTDLLNGTLTYSSYWSDTPEELRLVRNFCLIEKSESEVLMLGGIYDCGYYYGGHYDSDEEDGEHEEEHNKIYNKTVWSGCLSQDKTKIIWKDTGHKITFNSHKNRCFGVDDNIFLSYYNYGGNTCHLNGNDYDRYNWEEKKYYKNVFSLSSSSLTEYTGEHRKIDEGKQLIVVAARINHLMTREGCHVSVWFPVNRLYSRRQTLVFTRNEDACGCKCKRQFRKRHSEANSIFLLPILK